MRLLAKTLHFITHRHLLFIFCVTVLVHVPFFSYAENAQIYYPVNSEQVKFSASKLKAILEKKGYSVSEEEIAKFEFSGDPKKIVFSFSSDKRVNKLMKRLNLIAADSIAPEGFCIRILTGDSPIIWISATDEAGLMYGGYEITEIIETEGWASVKNQAQNPYMKMRGVKFNIPLDVRTPSYSDVSDAAQQNMAEMWNFDFWKAYIDSLSKFRYNFISLWNLHPFPSMVKVPDYPEVALDDVRRSKGEWKEFYSLNGHGFDSPEIVDNYEVLIKMTIEEKIAFWQKVMAYAKQRNIRFYILTWNIFTYGVDGKYGITDKQDNAVTRDYFRKSVRQMLLTYPDLAGIGLTTGENMYGLTTAVKEDWAYNTFGLGVLDVAKEQPWRKITLIHRQHQTGSSEIAKVFQPLLLQSNINFLFSFKYAQAHVYSSVNQVFHQSFVEDIRSNHMKTLWTLRNDDVFYFRWGAPNFVRSFIRNIPYDVSEGFYFGSDNYIWGRDFLSKYTTGQPQLEIAKHWYHWMLWGRLGYNPEIDNEKLICLIQSKFPKADARGMFKAWQDASMIYPFVTGFHWGALDFQWYIEGSKSASDPAQTPSGYHDVNRFITLPPHKGTGILSIPEFVKNTTGENQKSGKTPVELANEILGYADSALSWAETANTTKSSELFRTINDIRSMAWLGKYYGHKILAATSLALFRKLNRMEDHENCIRNLQLSALYWRYYASNALYLSNNPLWTNRVGVVDWKKTYQDVLYDLTANGAELLTRSMEPTKGGVILEAENAEFGIGRTSSDVSGYTGNGYVKSKEGDALQTIRWNFDAPEAGGYLLEFRYSMSRQENFAGKVRINGENTGELVFWPSGNNQNWVWDRINRNLRAGRNIIELEVEGWVNLDHLNLIKSEL